MLCRKAVVHSITVTTAPGANAFFTKFKDTSNLTLSSEKELGELPS